MTPSGPTASSVYDLPIERVEEALLTGEMRNELVEALGPELYAEASAAAKEAQAAGSGKRSHVNHRVYVIPGIMGSTLGVPRSFFGHDTIWLDPVDVIIGNLSKLSLGNGGDPSVVAVGVILPTYLLMRFRLLKEGYDAQYFSFDWRQDIGKSGEELAATIRRDIAKGRTVSLVAHSMGGLVGRVALDKLNPQEMASVERFIMLGTPNHGSFSPLQVFIGAHDLASKLASWDKKKDTIQLTRDIFSTFPGLWQMLPFATLNAVGFDLFDATQWPTPEYGVEQQKLASAHQFHQSIPNPDPAKAVLIAGVEVSTLVSLKRADDDSWVATRASAGDGTVPIDSAHIPGVTTHYARGIEHGSMPNSSAVRDAVVALLQGNEVQLPTSWLKPESPKDEFVVLWPQPEPTRLLEENASVSESTSAELRAAPTAAEVRQLLAPFAGTLPAAAPPANAPGQVLPPTLGVIPAAAVPAAPSFTLGNAFGRHGTLLRRPIEQRLHIKLLPGNVVDAEAEAYVIGVLENVTDVPPEGPMRDLDQILGGAITQLFQRRVFSARNGEAFILPTRGRRIAAEMVAFAGMGNLNNLSLAAFRAVGEATARTLLAAKVRSFATQVLAIATTTANTERYKENCTALLGGFISGLMELDRNRDMHEVVLCEPNQTLYRALVECISALPSVGLLEHLDLVVSELPAPSRSMRSVLSLMASGPQRPPTVYLEIIENLSDPSLDMEWTVSLLSAGTAMLPRLKQTINRAQFDQLVKTFHARATNQEIEDGGKALTKLLLPPTIQKSLEKLPAESPYVLIHSTEPSRVPWEALRLSNGIAPALGGGITRRYLSQDETGARWNERQRQDSKLRVLIVADPLGDLAAAHEEGNRVSQLLNQSRDQFEIVGYLEGPEATKGNVLNAFRTKAVDILHYAGHAFFDPKQRFRSGILLSTGTPEANKRKDFDVLTGELLASESALPAMVFFNACESGRVRSHLGEKFDATAANDDSEPAIRAVGPAEAFLRSGVTAFLGTYWPVGDYSARTFSSTFYQSITRGESVGAALTQARKQIDNTIDWANYIYYGSPEFRLKLK